MKEILTIAGMLLVLFITGLFLIHSDPYFTVQEVKKVKGYPQYIESSYVVRDTIGIKPQTFCIIIIKKIN